ncbi:MAG: TetR/AcrR family transcriptional regulator [Candidatus Omnitrophica bacterium]|nr:TetR/AcrR family transcriptional regulator [Candidatus Omnitrophota bacterium]
MPKHLTRERILNAAMNRMLRFGYRKVSMDEIAEDLVMSKNTIYRYFESKERMAEALFERLSEEVEQELALIRESYRDPSEVISRNVFFLQQRLKPWSESFLGDIKTELPALWARFNDLHETRIKEIVALVEDGIEKDKFRRVNAALAVRMYMGAMDHVLDPEYLEKERISFSDAIDGVLDIWSVGMVLKKEGGHSNAVRVKKFRDSRGLVVMDSPRRVVGFGR